MERITPEIMKKLKSNPDDYIIRKIRKNITFCKLLVVLKGECDKDNITYCNKIAKHIGYSQSYTHAMLSELEDYGIVKITPISGNFSQVELIKNDSKPVIDKFIDICLSELKGRGII